jgi:hypothetical protein
LAKALEKQKKTESHTNYDDNDMPPPFNYDIAITCELGTFDETGARVTLPYLPDNIIESSGDLRGTPVRSPTDTVVSGVYIHPRLRQATASRVIPVEGVRNFRDMGGYPTRFGRWMRTRYGFRCAE